MMNNDLLSWARLTGRRDRWSAVTLLALIALLLGMTSIVLGLWPGLDSLSWPFLGRPVLGLALVVLALPLAVAKYAPGSSLLRIVFVVGAYMSLGYGTSALVEYLMTAGSPDPGTNAIGRFSSELALIPVFIDIALALCGLALVVSGLRRLVWRSVARILAMVAVATLLIGVIPVGMPTMPLFAWLSMLAAAVATLLACDAPVTAMPRDLPAGEQQAVVTVVFMLGAVLAGVFLRWELGVTVGDRSQEIRLLRVESATALVLSSQAETAPAAGGAGRYPEALEAIQGVVGGSSPALRSSATGLRDALKQLESADEAPAAALARAQVSQTASNLLSILVAERESLIENGRNREALVSSVGVAAGLLIVTGWLLSVRSMGARARAEELARTAEVRFRTIFERSTDGVMLVDAGTGLPIEFNDAACDSLGYTRDEFAHIRFSDHEAEESMSDTVSHFRRILDEGKDQFYAIHKTKSGERRDVFVLVQTVDISGRRLLHCLFRDVTELKVAERRLAESVAELERSNAELEQFAYVASHDLQEPLRKVASFTQLLDRKYKGHIDEEADKYLYYIVDGANRMQVLIKDLLSYSRITTRARPPVRVDTKVLVDLVISDMQIAATEAEADIVVDDLPVILGDPSQLHLVFQNLIGNAFKFRGERGAHVHIGAIREGPMWEFYVTDQGIGFDPRYSEKIFSMFQRLHTRAEYVGTGIGLSVVKKIIERHGGSVSAESGPGPGATFRFTLSPYLGSWQLDDE